MEIVKAPDYKLYEKMLDIFLSLRDLRERFKCYSSSDINKLIGSKMKMKTLHEPVALQELYKLEAAIRDLRETMDAARIVHQSAPLKE